MAVQLNIPFETLLELVNQLPLSQKQALVEQLQSDLAPHDSPRLLNLHPDAIWISDDFTDPLPDEFWLGEE